MLSVSVYVSSSCIMAQWWPEFMVETSCHTNKSICKWVGCDCELIDIIQIFADHFIIENVFSHFPINNGSDRSRIPYKPCISLEYASYVSPVPHLTSYCRRVVECHPPAVQEVLHHLEIFFDTQQSLLWNINSFI